MSVSVTMKKAIPVPTPEDTVLIEMSVNDAAQLRMILDINRQSWIAGEVCDQIRLALWRDDDN